MTKRLIPLLLIMFFAGNCAPAPASLIPTPTATPYLPLQTQGPYLLFAHDNNHLTIMDADGSGRKPILLLPNGDAVRLQDCFPNIRCPNSELVWLP